MILFFTSFVSSPIKNPPNVSASSIEEELFLSLIKNKINTFFEFLPRNVRDTLNNLENNTAFLCGGSLFNLINGLPIKDFDLFFTQHSYDRVFCDGFITSNNVYTTNNAITTIDKTQFIKKRFSSLDEIFEGFDFSTVQIAVNKNREVFLGKTTLNDLISRKVKIVNPHNSFSSLKRLTKFTELGFDVQEAFDFLIKDLSTKSPQELMFMTDNNYNF